MIWCLGSHQVLHNVQSLCISTMRFFSFYMLERILKLELQKSQLSCPSPPTGCPAYPPLPLHLLLITIILLLLLPTLLLLPALQALPPLLQGPVGQGLGCLHTSLACPSPSGSKIMTGLKLFTSYKIVTGITRFKFSDGCHPDTS